MKKVWTPIKVGPLEVTNRLVHAPTVRNIATEEGYVTDRLIEAYKDIAAGGVGLIVAEATYIHPRGNQFHKMLGLWSDTHIAGHSVLVDEMKLTNPRVKVLHQIMMGGRQAPTKVHGTPPWAVSRKHPWPLASKDPQVMTTKECDQVVKIWGDAAARSKDAGYDGVYLHGAHGFLMWQFMAPWTNDRTDQYGDRLYFVRRVVEEIKDRCGKDYPITIRINGEDFLGPEGVTVDWNVKVCCPELEKMGICYIDVSAAPFETVEHQIQPMYFPRGYLLSIAEKIKKAVKIPISCPGKWSDPGLIEKVLEEGRIDMISLSRPLLADPDMPKKMMEGRYEDIRICVACVDGCIRRLSTWNLDVRCAINPECSFPELKLHLWPLKKRKKVFVVGGGPGGMEAARILGERGHDVTLYEKDKELGGRLTLAAAAPFTKEWGTFKKWLTTQLKKLNVKVELGKEVTLDLIKKEKPDAVILTTGSSPYIPKDIPGYNKKLVVTEDDAIKMGPDKLGKKVVILGGKAWGCEFAAWLGAEGKDVTIVEEGPSWGIWIEWDRATQPECLPKMFKEGGVKVLTEAKATEIKDNGVTVVDKAGKKQFIEANNVVLSLLRVPNDALEMKLRAELPTLELYAAGDCEEPNGLSRLMYSVHKASRVARLI